MRDRSRAGWGTVEGNVMAKALDPSHPTQAVSVVHGAGEGAARRGEKPMTHDASVAEGGGTTATVGGGAATLAALSGFETHETARSPLVTVATAEPVNAASSAHRGDAEPAPEPIAQGRGEPGSGVGDLVRDAPRDADGAQSPAPRP